MNIPRCAIESIHPPPIEVKRMEGQTGYQASCPTFPEIEPVTDDSAVIAVQLMSKRVQDAILQGVTRETFA